jgi:hypothetical protein
MSPGFREQSYPGFALRSILPRHLEYLASTCIFCWTETGESGRWLGSTLDWSITENPVTAFWFCLGDGSILTEKRTLGQLVFRTSSAKREFPCQDVIVTRTEVFRDRVTARRSLLRLRATICRAAFKAHLRNGERFSTIAAIWSWPGSPNPAVLPARI